MAGSGGATGQSSLEAYQKDTHSILLRGRSADATITAGVDWGGNAASVYGTGSTYRDNPSVLRFVKEKGITDSGGNPFEGVSAYDPEAELDSTDADFAELLSDVKALDPQADFSTFVQSALSQADSVVETLDVESIVTDVIDRAVSKASEIAVSNSQDAKNVISSTLPTIRSNADSNATEQITTSVDEASAAGTIIDESSDKGATVAADEITKGGGLSIPITSNVIEVGSTISDSITSTLEGNARDAAKTSMTSVINAVSPDVTTIIYQAIVGLKTTVRDIVSEASTLALEVVDAEQVTAAVEAYRKRALKVHLRNVNRFAGGMADIGAVNSSAFIMGMALLESDHQDNVDEFQARLELELYTQVLTTGMSQYVETFRNVFVQYMDSYERRFAQTLDIYKTNLPVYAQTFLTILPEYVRAYLQSLMDYIGLYNSTSTQNTQVATELVNKRLDLFSRNVDQEGGSFDKTLAIGAQNILGLASSEIDGTVRARIFEGNNRMQVAMTGTQLMTGMKDNKIRFRHASTTLLEQINRARIIALSEEYAKNLLYDVNSSNWDIELYQKAANVLAGVSGAVVSTAGKPSDAQTVLGSMASGASMGALAASPAGGIGAVGGAAIGAGVGLVAGLASLQFD
jgi:hypothetical protein